MLDKVPEKIKMIICIQIFDNTKILTGTDNKLADQVNLKSFVISISFVIKDDDKFYPQQFLKELLVQEIWWEVVKS